MTLTITQPPTKCPNSVWQQDFSELVTSLIQCFPATKWCPGFIWKWESQWPNEGVETELSTKCADFNAGSWDGFTTPIWDPFTLCIFYFIWKATLPIFQRDTPFWNRGFAFRKISEAKNAATGSFDGELWWRLHGSKLRWKPWFSVRKNSATFPIKTRCLTLSNCTSKNDVPRQNDVPIWSHW